MVAECMGKLALLEPTDLLPNLRDQLKSESPLVRSTVVTAIKFTILDQVRVNYTGLFLNAFCEGVSVHPLVDLSRLSCYFLAMA